MAHCGTLWYLMAHYVTLWHILLPCGTLCYLIAPYAPKKYLNFTKMYSSLRFIIFGIFVLLFQNSWDQTCFALKMYFSVRDGDVGRS